uniref:Uncharacterized protein n=1 Tax=Pseudomonas phage Cygsa01 TaxID=3138529 RepID=A0AAU6W4Y5_9VIRU
MHIVHKMLENQHISKTKEAVQNLSLSLSLLERRGWAELMSPLLLEIMDGASDLRCESWSYTVCEDLSLVVYLVNVEEQGPGGKGAIVWKPRGNIVFGMRGSIIELPPVR